MDCAKAKMNNVKEKFNLNKIKKNRISMKACCQVRIIYYYYYVSRRRVKTIHHTQLRRRGGTRSQITVYIVRILTYVHICKRNQISVDTYRINVCTIYAASNAMCVSTLHVTVVLLLLIRV